MLCVFVFSFMCVFSFVKWWFSVDKTDINRQDVLYKTLDKTWNLLELKVTVTATKNGNNALDIFLWLEKILINKINNINKNWGKNKDKYLILLYFVQQSIDSLSDKFRSNDTYLSIDSMIDDLSNTKSIINKDIYSSTRGIWFWSNANFDWWSFNVIWNQDKEDEVISDLQKYDVDRVYGSYGRSISADEDEVGNWNVKLHDVWIDSDLLIGSSFLSAINDKDKFFLNIQNSFLDFNESREYENEKLDAIHLDMEPQWMNGRSDLLLSEKKAYLYDLLDLFADLRTYLDNNDGEYVEIHVDLAHWFGNINSIWWDDENERNQRFWDIWDNVDGITLMTYENKKIDTLVRWASDEVDLLWDKIKISLHYDDRDSIDEFDFMLDEIDDLWYYAVDIHHYSRLKEVLIGLD